MHNRQGLTPMMILEALCDWYMWPLYILGMMHMGKWPMPEDARG